ncbi:hypothetical protein DACRYDRAFT_97901 [Dacryopinax primogenitus]|uniref:Zn(2)-C6 fungal-type domain-containing protein n=1 Tax=Dacryopinax primogenitus (strain DJM 731) TaxID=1858805 RepID=M5G8C0_DACPD|nr:uncharacterized protein DACRYDRAFT_97901 [Dacryopinax primogenitus]EJU06461.1 hypothetical protein DACRYDRAFT_97901 [Dacryopinax primogenitus]
MSANMMHSYSAGNPPALHIPARNTISPPKGTPTTGTPTNGVRKHSPDTEMIPGQKPSKRSRRAINCAPCRASKLKCDRARPCSGCVLRGTTNQCYTTEDGESRPEDYRNDPHNGIAQIRQGLAVIEAYFNRHGSLPPSSAPHINGHRGDSPPRTFGIKRDSDGEAVSVTLNGASNVPGANAELMPDLDKGGLYTGPTSASALFHFRNAHKRDLEHDVPIEEQGAACTLDPMSNLDLLSALPDVNIADRLINYFFENCTWVHVYIHPNSFLPNWERFKSSTCTDHVLLATIFIVLALAVLYTSPTDPVLAQLGPQQTASQIASNYYNSSCNALNRHRQGSENSPSLELIEYMLLRTQYLVICKDDCEDVWHIRGEVLSYATALGLHRDPGRWRLNAETVERRRWAWWNVLALGRWQAFLVGRPVAIANHHFDTLLPDGTDAFDSPPNNTGPYATHCQFFRLCAILGDILDSALSVKKVPYEKIMQHDHALQNWAEGLPAGCRTDPLPLGSLLVSNRIQDRRLAIQALHLNSAMYHIRFTLHRPFTIPVSSARGALPPMTPQALESYKLAVRAADMLINYVCTTLERCEQESQVHVGVPSPLTVPGHVGWGPYHIFHAAIYYSFQLIWQASGPYSEEHERDAKMFRDDIRRAIVTLEHLQAQGVRIAQKALNILRALAPLYEEVCVDHFEGECEMKMSAQLEFVRRLAFPWQHAANSLSPTLVSVPPMGQGHPNGSPTTVTTGAAAPHGSSPGTVYTPNGIDGAYAAAAGLMGPAQGGPPMAYNMQGDEGVWSTSLALDSDQWNRFLERVPNGNQINGAVPQPSMNAPGINGVMA